MSAASLIRKFGKLLDLETRLSRGTYNPATGTINSATTSTYEIYGYFYDYIGSEVDGTLVLKDDRKVMMATKDSGGNAVVPPNAGDYVINGTERNRIISVETIFFTAGKPEAYILQVRK